MRDSASSILILEDTRTVQNYIRDVLRPLTPEHPILLARRLAEAVKIAASATIALFIVDIGLPDGDGIDFLCEMSMLHPDSRALVITSTPTDDFRERARQLGVLHFLPKPLERRTLLDSVNRLLAPPSAPSGDPAGFEATLGGLSPVDIIQLKCLRRTTGAIELTGESFLAQVWFDGGEIIHAEAATPDGEHSGIEAFRRLITWSDGSIREVQKPRPVQRTIAISWQQLLLDTGTPAEDAALL